jgi:hypothetical protein
MDARLADDDGLKTREIEQIGEGLVAQIEASRIGAEGRQDATARIRGEATPPQSTGARRDMRHRVQMAGNLALHTRRSRAWFVTGGDAPDMAGKRMVARKPGWRARIVISRDPYPIAPELQAARPSTLSRAAPSSS